MSEQVVEEEGKTQEDKTATVETVVNEVETFSQQQNVFGSCWWQSGDARHLFAPSNTLHESDCEVKRIVMERIELLEAVNHASHNWKTVVDTRSCDGSRFNSYSEQGGVFSLRFWSMYLALALKQFVANATSDIRT